VSFYKNGSEEPCELRAVPFSTNLYNPEDTVPFNKNLYNPEDAVPFRTNLYNPEDAGSKFLRNLVPSYEIAQLPNPQDIKY
jgi:hypothetical protein